MANDYNFNTSSGIDSLRIKNAIIDSMLPNALQNLTTNIARNQGFAESLAKQLAASYLPLRGVNSIDQAGEARQTQLDRKGADISLSITSNPQTNTDPSDPNYGLFNNAKIISNLELVSTYTQRNFFDASQDFIDTTTLQVPIATIGVSFSNKFVESSPVGYRGTIKERMGSSDYIVNIEGVLISAFFGDDVNEPAQNKPFSVDLETIAIRNGFVTVNSPWLENKTLIDLSNCAVMSYSLPADNTVKNIQRFSLKLKSDKLINIL